jgi:5-(carboxyamino)imidazole ribonucleotide synthase
VSAVSPLKPGKILPGGLIAILGGGQLGRMTAMAARTMGYRVRVMDPEAKCPASFVVDETIVGRWDDVDAARRLAEGADVVTLEIEQIGVDALRVVDSLAPLRPGVEPIRIIQDKTLQKPWLADNGFPVGPFRVARNAEELLAAVPALGGHVFVKTGRGGYDGRGQIVFKVNVPAGREQLIATQMESILELMWPDWDERPCVVEQALDLDFEISVMAARSASGEVRAFPAARNHHENKILAWSVLPANVPRDLEIAAEALAAAVAAKLSLVGLLCAELFVTRTGELFINELAPRPHNSYHQSERGCATSQFEQLVRAVCNLPLGSTDLIAPCAIANLLGDLWLSKDPDWAAALQVPGVRLHLYEKHTPRAGRKMGHLSAVGATAEEALERVLEAKKRL